LYLFVYLLGVDKRYAEKRNALEQSNTAKGEVIETSRLQLCRPTGAETKEFVGLWRDERVRQFLGGTVPQERVGEKIASLQEHWKLYGFGMWVVRERQIGRVLGLCGLHQSHLDAGIELSYQFFPAYWGRGYATEAVTVSLDYGLRHLGFNCILAVTQAANLRSCRLLKRVGMHHCRDLWEWNALQRVYELVQDREETEDVVANVL
jgi:ribosomal-protein-alanine N-acetyltransferase